MRSSIMSRLQTQLRGKTGSGWCTRRRCWNSGNRAIERGGRSSKGQRSKEYPLVVQFTMDDFYADIWEGRLSGPIISALASRQSSAPCIEPCQCGPHTLHNMDNQTCILVSKKKMDTPGIEPGTTRICNLMQSGHDKPLHHVPR